MTVGITTEVGHRSGDRTIIIDTLATGQTIEAVLPIGITIGIAHTIAEIATTVQAVMAEIETDIHLKIGMITIGIIQEKIETAMNAVLTFQTEITIRANRIVRREPNRQKALKLILRRFFNLS